MRSVIKKDKETGAGKLGRMLIPFSVFLLVLLLVSSVLLYLGGTFGMTAEDGQMRTVTDNFLSIVSITLYAASAVLLCIVYVFGVYNDMPDNRLLLLIAFYVMLFLGRCHPYFLLIIRSPGGLWGIEMMQWLCLLPLFLFGAFL